jgi:hypothetical protein
MALYVQLYAMLTCSNVHKVPALSGKGRSHSDHLCAPDARGFNIYHLSSVKNIEHGDLLFVLQCALKV